MNQFFPDIKSLASFLIAQNSQTETKTDKDTGQVGFGDLLGLQMLINQNAPNAALNSQSSDDLMASYWIMAQFAQIGNSNWHHLSIR
jgi:hypothetical protein